MNIISNMSVIQIDNIALKKVCEKDFKNLFGLELGDYFDALTGFDIVKFDENLLKSPDGMSCRDVILEKYGEEAVGVIQKLLKI